ncbi:MAG: cytochrome c [Chloroflexota bacterium]
MVGSPRKPARLLLVVACFLLGSAACSNQATTTPTFRPLREVAGTPAATIPPAPTLDPAAVTLGQQVYTAHCAECHGANLEGQPDWKQQNEDGSFRAPPHDASGHTWHHSDRLLLETIRLGGQRLPATVGGTSNMPAFAETLTEAEMQAVLTYFKSSWSADIRATQWEMTVMDTP